MMGDQIDGVALSCPTTAGEGSRDNNSNYTDTDTDKSEAYKVTHMMSTAKIPGISSRYDITCNTLTDSLEKEADGKNEVRCGRNWGATVVL